MKLLGALTFFAGVATTYYGLFMHGEKMQEEGPTYQEPPKPPVLLNDDRQTFTTTSTSSNPVGDSNVSNQDTGEIKGYPLPDSINGLKVDGNGQVMIITKQPAFGQGARGMFPVGVDFNGSNLIYKQNDGQLKFETYQNAKSKVILSDKKYLK
ncbi:MAG: hypothetical protein RLZ10_2124 [Bacteroidota bacterium]|jgi:hypothetical protein